MACVVCKSPEVKYRCVDCADELCAEHAVACVGCRKPLCPAHVSMTPGGRILCNTCMRARNERHNAARKDREAPPAPKAESFSFQDLMSDLPPIPVPPDTVQAPPRDVEGGMGISLTQGQRPPRGHDDPRDDRNAGGPHGLDEVPDPDIDRKLAQMLGEGEKSVRVLTGSAPKGRPMWMGSTFLGVLTWVVFLLIPNYQPYSTYVVLILSLGTAAWAVSGMRNEKDTAQERQLNIIGLVLAFAAAASAILYKMGHS